jgi:steroid delta-isomerase-like uncharacterized protein
MVDAALRTRREEVVRRHMESENTHELEVTLGTFSHPRYELVATGQVYDGEAQVRQYFHETRTAFPDQRNEIISLRHADDAVVVEFWLLGTHRGPLMGVPATGKAFRARMTAFFIFEGDRIVCERVYFDTQTILRQLLEGAGPLGWLRALLGLRRGQTQSRKSLNLQAQKGD